MNRELVKKPIPVPTAVILVAATTNAQVSMTEPGSCDLIACLKISKER